MAPVQCPLGREEYKINPAGSEADNHQTCKILLAILSISLPSNLQTLMHTQWGTHRYAATQNACPVALFMAEKGLCSLYTSSLTDLLMI